MYNSFLKNFNFAIIILIIFLICFAISYCFLNLEITRSLIYSITTVSLISCLINPFFGLCILMFSIPYSGLLVMQGGAYTANKIFALLVFLSFLVHLSIKTYIINFKFNKTFSLYLVITFINFVYYFTSNDPNNTMIFLKVNLSLCGFIFLISYIPQNISHFKIMCTTCTISASFLGAYIIFFGIDKLVGTQGTRLAAGTNENVLAHALGIFFLISLFLFNNSNFLAKIFLVIADFFILLAIALTGSRGTWVALLFSIIIIQFLAPEIKIKKKILFSSSLIFIFSGLWFGLIYGFFGRSGEIFLRRVSEVQFNAEASSGRLDFIWPFWVEKILENPILGGGLGTTDSIGISTHNDILGVSAEQGILGLLLFTGLFIAMFIDIRSVKEPWTKMCLLNLLIFLFIAGLTHNTLYLKSFSVALGIISFFAVRNDEFFEVN